MNNIPEGWRSLALEEITREESLRVGRRQGVRVLSSTKHHGLVPSDEYFKNRTIYSSDLSNYKLVPRNYFAYATNHLAEGSIGLQRQYDIACVSPAYTVFSCDLKQIDVNYMFRLLKSPPMMAAYGIHEQASVDRRGAVRYRDFSRIKVLLPPKEEQRRIAEILDALDSRFAVGVSIVQKLGLISQGMLHDFMSSYTGGVGKRGVQVRCSDGFRLASGRPYPAERSQGQGGVPIYGASGAFSYGDLSMTPGPTFTIGRVGEGSVGVVNYVPGEAWVTDNALWATWVHSDWSPKFIAYYLKWFNLRKVRSQTGQPLVTQTVISPLPLPRPSLEEQVRAVEVLDSVNSQMDQERTVLAKLSSLKQGLAEDLLTGRVRVPEAEAVVESL